MIFRFPRLRRAPRPPLSRLGAVSGTPQAGLPESTGTGRDGAMPNGLARLKPDLERVFALPPRVSRASASPRPVQVYDADDAALMQAIQAGLGGARSSAGCHAVRVFRAVRAVVGTPQQPADDSVLSTLANMGVQLDALAAELQDRSEALARAQSEAARAGAEAAGLRDQAAGLRDQVALLGADIEELHVEQAKLVLPVADLRPLHALAARVTPQVLGLPIPSVVRDILNDLVDQAGPEGAAR